MSFAPRFEAEGSLSRGVEEAFALLDQAADLTGVEVGLRVVVRELSEGERLGQVVVEAGSSRSVLAKPTPGRRLRLPEQVRDRLPPARHHVAAVDGCVFREDADVVERPVDRHGAL